MPLYTRDLYTPEWLKPENASVLDSYWKKLARTVASLAGANDPAATAMGLGGVLAFPGAKTAAAAEEVAPEVLAKAKALYFERGHGGRGSVAGLAQALTDAGYRFGPMRRAVDKRAANALVTQLLGEVETAAPMVPESPFAGPR